ncbi:MAG: 4'-phosphopantetheinyl transferase superfamily protein [Actinobacteria bacterium]|nr:4'-phosphopantetheinyl transferase superfamily protein [Actinomycetota bacterium]
MIGFDLVETSRIASKLGKPVRDDLFLPGELSYAETQPDPAQTLAARYAAKEAVVKALGMDGWEPLEVEIVGGGERTSVRLHGDVRRRAEELGVEVTISMSHLDSICGAAALGRPRRSSEVDQGSSLGVRPDHVVPLQLAEAGSGRPVAE